MRKSLKSYQPCDLCGGSNYLVVLPQQESEDKLAFAFAGSNSKLTQMLLSCKECGLVQTLRVLSQNELLEGYKNNPDELHDTQFDVRYKTFLKSLRKILDTLDIDVPVRGKFIDVGCSSGAVLAAANDLGFESIGIEPSKSLVQKGRNRGLNVIEGVLPSQLLDSVHYDFVSSWDVIEHVESPREFLENIYKICTSSSYLVINTPNYDSWQRKVLGKFWPFFLEVHLFYFTPETISKLMSDIGFDVVNIKKHVQCLELGYLVQRFFPARRLPKLLYQIPIWYKMGQITITARISK